MKTKPQLKLETGAPSVNVSQDDRSPRHLSKAFREFCLRLIQAAFVDLRLNGNVLVKFGQMPHLAKNTGQPLSSLKVIGNRSGLCTYTGRINGRNTSEVTDITLTIPQEGIISRHNPMGVFSSWERNTYVWRELEVVKTDERPKYDDTSSEENALTIENHDDETVCLWLMEFADLGDDATKSSAEKMSEKEFNLTGVAFDTLLSMCVAKNFVHVDGKILTITQAGLDFMNGNDGKTLGTSQFAPDAKGSEEGDMLIKKRARLGELKILIEDSASELKHAQEQELILKNARDTAEEKRKELERMKKELQTKLDQNTKNLNNNRANVLKIEGELRGWQEQVSTLPVLIHNAKEEEADCRRFLTGE